MLREGARAPIDGGLHILKIFLAGLDVEAAILESQPADAIEVARCEALPD
jgi:hypothetical protein